MSLQCDFGQFCAEMAAASAKGFDRMAVRAERDHVPGVVGTGIAKLQNVIDVDNWFSLVVHVIRLAGAARVPARVLVPVQHGAPGACRPDRDGDCLLDRAGRLPLEEAAALTPVFRLPGYLLRLLREEIVEIRQGRIPQVRVVQPLKPEKDREPGNRPMLARATWPAVPEDLDLLRPFLLGVRQDDAPVPVLSIRLQQSMICTREAAARS